jgi:hypothetical protein
MDGRVVEEALRSRILLISSQVLHLVAQEFQILRVSHLPSIVVCL